MKAFPCILAVAFLAGAGVAFAAAERTITQKGKQFSETNVAIKKGDTLVFLNDDNVAHNIYSQSAQQRIQSRLGAAGPLRSRSRSTRAATSTSCARFIRS